MGQSWGLTLAHLLLISSSQQGEQDWQAPHCPVQGDRLRQVCAGGLIPTHRGTGMVPAHVPKKLY
jgi:hypothetical protein